MPPVINGSIMNQTCSDFTAEFGPNVERFELRFSNTMAISSLQCELWSWNHPGREAQFLIFDPLTKKVPWFACCSTCYFRLVQFWIYYHAGGLLVQCPVERVAWQVRVAEGLLHAWCMCWSFYIVFSLFVFCFQMLQEELNIIFHHMGEISMWYHNLNFKRQGGACSVSCIYTSYHVFSCFLINCAGQRKLRSLTGPQEMTFLCFQPREASACFICFSLTSFYPTTCLSLSTCLNIAEAPTHHPRAPAAREGFS